MAAKFGHVTSQATKDKIRAALLWHPVSKETRLKQSKQRLGVKWSVAEIAAHKNCHNGAKHWNWKGGRRLDVSNGYVYLYDSKTPRGVLEHRVVAEKFLNRKLKPKEVIHHINMIESDNRPQNLYLFKNRHKHLWFHRKHNLNPEASPILKSNICEN